MNFFQKFKNLNKASPTLFNTISGITLFGLGDFIQQKSDLNKAVLKKDSKNTSLKEYNYYQTFKVCCYAGILGPTMHPFYTRILPRLAPLSAPPKMVELMKKTLIDFCIVSPM